MKSLARWLILILLAGVISSAIFFVIPIMSALVVHKPPREIKKVPSVTQVDLAPRRHLAEAAHKEIRQITQQPAKAFRPSRDMGMAAKGFRMDLSLAGGNEGDGGVGVGGGGTGEGGSGSGFGGVGGGSGLSSMAYDPSEVDQQVRVLKELKPDYPPRARKDGVNGYVKFYLVVDVRGMATEVQLLSVDPSGYGFEIEAEKALRQFRFAPAKLRDVPVAQKFTKEFVFDLGY